MSADIEDAEYDLNFPADAPDSDEIAKKLFRLQEHAIQQSPALTKQAERLQSLKEIFYHMNEDPGRDQVDALRAEWVESVAAFVPPESAHLFDLLVVYYDIWEHCLLSRKVKID